MAEERDPLVSRRYRQLGSEEPSAALDERILARSRRRRSFQWHGPVAAAAVIVLAVAITVHVEREQPAPETIAASAPSEAQQAPKDDPQPAKQYAEPTQAEKPKPAPRRRDEAKQERFEMRQAPAAPPPAATREPALEAQRAPSAGAAADSASKPMASPESRLAKSRVAELAGQSPQQWLEGIAELRAQGRHAEADESLRQFRERYPDHAITDEMKAKIERR